MLLNGAKSFDDKTASMDESGNVITKDALGQTTAINPAAVKAEKTSPVMVNGVPKTVKVPGTNEVKILNKDGTLSPGGSMPVTKPKQPRLQQVTNENGTFLLNIDTGEVKPVMIGGTQLKPVKPAQTPSGEESNAAGFLVRMKDATKLLDTFEGQGKPNIGTSVSGSIPLIGGYLERSAQTKEQQQYKNAALAWIRAKLRKESGAAIGKAEAEQEYQNYFPVVGDTKEVIAQKRSLRQSAMDEMRIASGKAASKVDEARPKNEAYQLYVQHWNAAKNNPALQKQLTDRAREMGIVK